MDGKSEQNLFTNSTPQEKRHPGTRETDPVMATPSNVFLRILRSCHTQSSSAEFDILQAIKGFVSTTLDTYAPD